MSRLKLAISTVGKSWESFRARRRISLAALAVTAACTLGFAPMAYANGHHGTHHRKAGGRLAVFSHPAHRRRHRSHQSQSTQQSAGEMRLRAGAVLAETVEGTEVYVSEDDGIICLILVEPSSGGESCGMAASVEQNGMLDIGIGPSGHVHVAAVVPNGVASITLRDDDGAVHTAAVVNNVMLMYDANVSSVEYKLPSGSMRVVDIPPAVTKRWEVFGKRA